MIRNYFIMLKSGSGFDEVSAYMHCLVMMTTFQEEHQKVWNFSLSLKEENTIFIEHFWITPCLCVVVKNLSGASNDLEKKWYSKYRSLMTEVITKSSTQEKVDEFCFGKRCIFQTLKDNSLLLCSMLWCLCHWAIFLVKTESFSFFFFSKLG